MITIVDAIHSLVGTPVPMIIKSEVSVLEPTEAIMNDIDWLEGQPEICTWENISNKLSELQS